MAVGNVREVRLNLHQVHFRVRRVDKDETGNLLDGVGKQILRRMMFQVYRPILPKGLMPDVAPRRALREEDAANLDQKGFIEEIWRKREKMPKPELEGYWSDMGRAMYSAAPSDHKLKWDVIMVGVDHFVRILTTAGSKSKRSLFETIYFDGSHVVLMALDKPVRRALLRSLSGHEINMLYKEMLNQRGSEELLKALFEALDQEGFRKLFYEHYKTDDGNDCSGLPTLEQTLLARVGRKNRLAFFRAAQGSDLLLAAFLIRQVDQELFQDKIVPILAGKRRA